MGASSLVPLVFGSVGSGVDRREGRRDIASAHGLAVREKGESVEPQGCSPHRSPIRPRVFRACLPRAGAATHLPRGGCWVLEVGVVIDVDGDGAVEWK